ncbi:MAG: hypothetical protein U9N56_05980, partial [Actinomycetota bacterium]|nr:hypothetical protein [Actinomycetota bacterium]
DISPGEMPYWPLAWERALSDPWRWVKEVIGLGYLAWLWFALGLNHKDKREFAVQSGRLPEYIADES